MPQSRQLAAIMFTDIVGYTAVMQKDEALAVSIIKHYNTTLEEKVKQLNGRVLNYYGDGSLCIFSIAQDAATCALAIQKELKNDPAVPLRIGLHIGEVFFENEKALGDGVNVASRIQSLGTENTILLSAEFHDKIKNNSSFTSIQLGTFDFKSVDKPIEVYALTNEGLATPHRNKMQGKLNKNKSYNRVTVFASIFLIAAVTFVAFNYERWFKKPEEKSIAVLPFVDMTPNADMDYLGDGIAEEIINSLTTLKDLKVIGRTSSFQFKGEKVDLREVGEKLHVGIVLEGSIQKFEDNFRITAQLVRTNDNFHIWSERFDLKQMNIFKIQDNIASAIVTKLKLTLSSTEKGKIIKKEINEAAYTLFLKGLFKYKAEKFTEAVNYLSESIKIDPMYAESQAYMGLSKAWICAKSNTIDSTLLKEAWMYSERAIELDPNLAEGYSSLALIAWRLQNDFVKARIYFEKSISLNSSSSLIKNRYGYFLTWMGDFQKANQLANEAIKLDPADYNGYMILFNVALYSKDQDDATEYLEAYRRFFGFDQLAFYNKIKLDFLKRSYHSVIDQLDSINATGASLDASRLSILSRAYFKLRQINESDKVLAKLKDMANANFPNSCFAISLVYALRNETDTCILYLKKSSLRRESDFIFLKIEPAFESIRTDQRFMELLHQNGFDRY